MSREQLIPNTTDRGLFIDNEVPSTSFSPRSIEEPTAPATEDANTISVLSNAYTYAGSEGKAHFITNKTSNGEGPEATTNADFVADEDKPHDSLFKCNICLDQAKDAVVGTCGHMFCWPCLHQWLLVRPNRKLCPVCKAGIDKDKIIPLYGRNSTRQEDSRSKIPPRPPGQRIEPESFQNFGFGDGFHMSFGIGAFPFGYFASSFNFGGPRPAVANGGATQYEDEQLFSRLFLYLAFLCIAWLLFN